VSTSIVLAPTRLRHAARVRLGSHCTASDSQGMHFRGPVAGAAGLTGWYPSRRGIGAFRRVWLWSGEGCLAKTPMRV